MPSGLAPKNPWVLLTKRPHFVIVTPFFPCTVSILLIKASAMLSSFCSPCSIAEDWEVLYTNNSLLLLDGEVVGLRLATRLHLDAVILPFRYKNQSDCWLWSLVFFIKSISLSLKFSFLFIPCSFCIISSTLGGWVLKGNIQSKVNGCSWLNGLPWILVKGTPFVLVCSVISSMASVASFDPCAWSGNIWRPTAERSVLISSALNCKTRFSLLTAFLGRGS